MTSRHRHHTLRLFWLVACAAILTQTLASAALAATPIYVRPGGNDTICNGEYDLDEVDASPTSADCAVQTIQQGVDLVDVGGTVNVAAGTYEEQVEIDSDLTLQGAGPTTIIQSPTNLTEFFTTSADNYPIVYIHDADDVTIQDLEVDGAGRGNSNYRFIGIGFHNAGGTVDSVEVTDIRDTPFSGSQHGVAIYSYNDDTVARSVDVYDSTVTGFQKTAVALNAADDTPLTVDVAGNTIVGAGTTPTTAQNGIQVFADLATGTVDDNDLSGIAYDGASWVATTILNYYGDVDITNNDIVDAQVGIYNIEGAGSLTGNLMSVIEAGDYSWGIIATDPPYAVPQPFDIDLLGGGEEIMASGVAGSQAGGHEAAMAPHVTLAVDVSNNTIVYNDSNDGNRYGIEAAAGYDPNDMDVTIDDNIVDGFETGIVWFQCEGSCDTGMFVGMSATGNCLGNNVTAMESNVGYLQVDAEDNWWGDASGPYHATENPGGLGAPAVGDIDVSPWATTGCSQTGAWLNTRTGILGSLQETIDNALSGDTLRAVGPSAGGANVGTDGITIDLNGQTVGAGSPAFTVSADDVTIAGPGTLDGGGDASPAILVEAGADNLIVDGVEITDWADGIQVEGDVTSFKLVNSWLHDNADAGLQIDSGVSLGGIVTIEGNLFKDNGGNGIQNDGATDPLPAEYNSWGDIDGPTDTGDAGDGVSSMVDYDPWTFAEMFLDMDPATAPTPDETTVGVDEDESFDVTLDLDAENLYGITFQIDYDDSMLTLDGVAFASPWSGGICADLGSTPGSVSYYCNLISGPAWDASSGTFATLSFTAEDNGGLTGDGPWTNYLDIAHMEADSSTAAIGGVKVFLNNAGYGAPSVAARDITDTDDGQIDITGLANYSTFVDLQGRANDSGATLSVFDQLTIAGSTELANGASASSGALNTAHLAPETLTVGDTYYLQIDRDLFLPTTADADTDYAHSALLDTRPYTSLGNVVLLGGDAYNDNTIDMSDASCIGGAYGTAATTCGGGSPAGSSPDVNEDGIVDILDLVLMGGNYTLTASPWTP